MICIVKYLENEIWEERLMAIFLHVPSALACAPGIQAVLVGGLGNWLCGFEGWF